MSFFTVENLKELGLTEEQVKKIFSERGKELAKYNDYDSIKEKYKQQGEELEKLKKLEPDKLKNQIEELSNKHREELKNIESKYNEDMKRMTIKMGLNDVHDADLVLNLLDLSKIDLKNDGSVGIGLNEQIENLRKEKSFLFKSNDVKIEATEPVDSEATKQTNNEGNDIFTSALLMGAGIKE